MKKTIGIIAILIVGFVGFKGYQYYNNMYKASLAYAVVPEKIPEKEESVDYFGGNAGDENGKKSYTYKYKFDFEKQDGSKETIEYRLEGTDVKPFKPGTRLSAMISKMRVIEGPFVEND